MRARHLVLGCLLAVLAGAAHSSTSQVWVWVDAKGVRHFSDRPVPGAHLMSITAPPPSANIPAAAPTRPTAATRTPPEATVTYTVLEIFEPENDESFFGGDTVVNVRIRTEPELANGDVARLYLDGTLVEGEQRGLEYSLTDLERGAHSIVASIVDARGNVRIRSEPRMFHIRQPSVVNSPNVGPALRPPPPRPQPRPSGGR